MANEIPDIRIAVSMTVPEIGIEVARNWKTVEFGIDKGGEYHLPYGGPYEVDPSLYRDTTLLTYGRSMTDDVKVNKVPVYQTSNPQGGITVTIGA